MALRRTAKKRAQQLLLPVNQSRWAIAALLRAECSSRQLGHRWGIKHGRAPAAHPAREGEAQSKWFLGNTEISTAHPALLTVTELKQPERLYLCLPPLGLSSCLPPPWRLAFVT